MDQVDFVEIFHWHYSELVFQIEEEDELQELKAFFDALDCQLDEPIESPDRYAGAGTDRIFFYGDGVLIGQYTIYAELVQFKPYGAWYIMDDETGLAWRAYVDGLKASADQ